MDKKVKEQVKERLTYTTREVCQLLGISNFTLYRMIKTKAIRPLAIQKNPYLFPKSEVDRVLIDMISGNYYKED